MLYLKVHFAAAARELNIGLVFVNSLERSVVGDRAISERQPPRLGDAFACMLAAHDLSSEKELLDLVFSESGVVGGTGNARASEASHCSENEPPQVEIMSVHRSTLPDGAHKSTPSASRSATQNVRNPAPVLEFQN